MGKKRFAVFILSHGRPDNVKTIKLLEADGYTGDWYIIIDNEDSTAQQYYENFGKERVIMFDKKASAKTMDTAINTDDRRVILFARNECFRIAKELGIDYFLELDDDYVSFTYRWIENEKLLSKEAHRLDDLFDYMLDFLIDSDADTVAFAQGGDFIGGAGSSVFRQRIKRKAMNTFFCRTDRPLNFLGLINEDVNTYVLGGSRGRLFLQVSDLMLTQTDTQKSGGGMSDVYSALGTYTKSFYSIVINPSCVKIWAMGAKHYRLHHTILWDNAVPKIINQVYKK